MYFFSYSFEYKGSYFTCASTFVLFYFHRIMHIYFFLNTCASITLLAISIVSMSGYVSHAMIYFHETEFEIWAGIRLAGIFFPLQLMT